MNTRVYSSLLADLASHGYVVMAIDPTYEVFATTLSGGRVAGFHSPGWFGRPVEDIVRYERSRLLVWAADTRFAIERLRRQPPFESGPMSAHSGVRRALALLRISVRPSAS